MFLKLLSIKIVNEFYAVFLYLMDIFVGIWFPIKVEITFDVFLMNVKILLITWELIIIKFECIPEGWSLSYFRFKTHWTLKLIYYFTSYHKSKPNTIFVHLLSTVDKAEKLKEFSLIFFFNSNPCINNRDFEIFSSFLYNFNNYSHMSFFCKL